MSQRDPKQDIIEQLISSRAKAGTIRFLKERSIPHHHLYAVSYETETGQQHTGIYFATRREKEHISGATSFLLEIDGQPSLRRAWDSDKPWLNMVGGFGWEDSSWGLWAGGKVIDRSSNITRVRLISADGKVVEDSVEDGVVLFLTGEQMKGPVEAELYNSAGELVSKRVVLHSLRSQTGPTVKEYGRFQLKRFEVYSDDRELPTNTYELMLDNGNGSFERLGLIESDKSTLPELLTHLHTEQHGEYLRNYRLRQWYDQAEDGEVRERVQHYLDWLEQKYARVERAIRELEPDYQPDESIDDIPQDPTENTRGECHLG